MPIDREIIRILAGAIDDRLPNVLAATIKGRDEFRLRLSIVQRRRGPPGKPLDDRSAHVSHEYEKLVEKELKERKKRGTTEREAKRRALDQLADSLGPKQYIGGRSIRRDIKR